MDWISICGAILAVGIVGYLLLALLFPEKLS